GVTVPARLEELDVLRVLAMGGDRPSIDLREVHGDDDVARLREEDLPLVVAAGPLAHDRQTRLRDRPPARDLAHVDLRVDPIADEVVGDRLVDGPNAVEALDDVRQLYDLGPVGVPLPDGFHGVRAGRP